MISLQNAAFGYDGKPVVTGVSLSVKPGDFIAVAGENGTGKSTLLKGMLGLLPPLRGKRIVATEAERHIGYVPQRGQLDAAYPLTVFDVVRMAVSSANAAAVVAACLGKVRMTEKADASYSALSGGQQQRVLIARALAVVPRVLVMDEPTSGVDAVTEKEIFETLRDLNSKDETAVVVVSHDMPMLHQFAKTVIRL